MTDDIPDDVFDEMVREGLDAEIHPSLEPPAVGSVWRRQPPGREVVRIERVWLSGDEVLVRAHPTRGGKPLVASVEVLRERYIRDGDSDD